MTDRPICGNCPHFLEIDGGYECAVNPPTPLMVFELNQSYAQTPGQPVAYSHRPLVDESTPACLHHPDMPRWLEMVRPQPVIDVELQQFTWVGLNCGELSVEAPNEDIARTTAVKQLRALPTSADGYSEADRDFDLMQVTKSKPEVSDAVE